MSEEEQPVGDTDRELTDADLDHVSGGNIKRLVPDPQPITKPDGPNNSLIEEEGIFF